MDYPTCLKMFLDTRVARWLKSYFLDNISWFPLTDFLDFVAVAKGSALKLCWKLKVPFERQHKKGSL